MQLYPFQEEAIRLTANSIKSGNRTNIIHVPTGGGKTVIAAEIIKRSLAKSKKVLFIAPRRELVEQASDKLHSNGSFNTLIMSGEELFSSNCYVASSDTLYSWVFRKERFPMPLFDLVIYDEAHLSMSKTRLEMLRSFNCPVIGLTATPARGDRKPLGAFYQKLITVKSIKELIAEKYLVQPRYFGSDNIDLSGIPLRPSDKDYMPKPLAERMNKNNLIGDIVKNWKRLTPNKKTVVFCVDIKHSIAVAEQFRRNGIAAEHIDAYALSSERKAIFNRLRSGETKVITNVFLASYGLDIPDLEVCVLARPTRNLTLYIQMVGRVLRTHESKQFAYVIDHSNTVDTLGFVEDDFIWDIHSKERPIDQKTNQIRERKEPKEIKCPSCGSIFKGSRKCPSCGNELIKSGAIIPVHEAELKEIKPKHSIEEKRTFLSELLAYADQKNKPSDWAYDVYRYRFKCSPSSDKIRPQAAIGVSQETFRYITHINIARARRRAANNRYRQKT